MFLKHPQACPTDNLLLLSLHCSLHFQINKHIFSTDWNKTPETSLITADYIRDSERGTSFNIDNLHGTNNDFKTVTEKNVPILKQITQKTLCLISCLLLRACACSSIRESIMEKLWRILMAVSFVAFLLSVLTKIYDESFTVRTVIRKNFQRISFPECLLKSRQVEFVMSAAKDNLIILSLCLINFIESH